MTDTSSDRDPVKPDEGRVLLGTGKARAIDLREEDEFSAGHAPGAKMVVDGDVEATAREVLRDDDDVAVMVFCADGDESEDAAGELREAGIDAFSAKGGWKAWTSAGNPRQPDEDEEYEGPTLKQPGA